MSDDDKSDIPNTAPAAAPASEATQRSESPPPPPPPQGTSYGAAPYASAPYASAPYNGSGYGPDTRSPNQKSPALAAFLAFFPGMGHVYNGLYQRGVVLFLVFAGCIAMVSETGSPIFGFAIAFTWMFNVLDAYRQANLINHGYAADLGMLDHAKLGKPGNGTMVAGVLIFLVGLFELLEEYDLFDWDFIWRNWAALLMAGGVWMVWSALRERREVEAD